MNLEDDIFIEYFRRIGDSGEVPKSVSTELKRRFDAAESTTEDELREILKKGCDDGSKDKAN